MLRGLKESLKKRLFKWAKRTFFRLRTQNKKVSILWYPVINTLDELNREISRCVWYQFPALEKTNKIIFIVGKHLTEYTLSKYACPEYADPNLSEMSCKFDGIIYFISEKEFDKYRFSDFDIVVEWKKTLKKKTIFPYVIDADVNYNQFEANQIIQINSLIQNVPFKRLVQENSKKLHFFLSELRSNISYENVLLIGSGPSLGLLYEQKIDPSTALSIVCNSVVKNDEVFDLLCPKIVVASDAVFHSGYSKYASEFRSMLIKRLRNNPQLIFIVPIRDYWIYMHNLPGELTDRIIGIPVIKSHKFNFDIMKKFFVKSTSNVLTLLMFPIGATFKKNILYIGFDGRNKTEKDIFWEYNIHSQFNLEYDSTKLAHPAFYKVNYEQYYENHCFETQELIDQMPDKNIIRGLTHSNIPALEQCNG